MNKVFLAALPVIQKIVEAGFEAYFVGGAVRDHLLKREIHDVDIATSATPTEIKSIFSFTVDVGIEHGTILVVYKGQSFEVTTFRSESDYKDFRRPDSVIFIRSLHEDLKRRDFTINAMAMDTTGTIIDPFGGQLALENKLIMTVGKAEERFQEDALRLMRAIRFVGQLGFNLEKNTEAQLAIHAHLLEHIAVERISAEMTKLLKGKYKERALELALSSQLYTYWPSLLNNEQLIRSVLSLPIQGLGEIEMWLLFLFMANTDDPSNQLKKWKLPRRKIKTGVQLLSILNWRMNNEWTDYQLYCAGKEAATIVETVYSIIHHQDGSGVSSKIAAKMKELTITTRSDLVISGKDLLEWTKKPGGPWLKSLFEELEKSILNREISNNVVEIRRWVESCQLLSKNK